MSRDPCAARNHARVQSEQEQRAGQSELLGENRKDKIGALLGQKIQPRLRPLQKSFAHRAAGPDRDFILDYVIAGSERIGLRIDEANQALALIRLEIVPAERSR